MPVLSHLGPAAPSGLTRYESRAFGDDYRDNLFAALFNMHKVTRHVLEPSGATFKSRDSDFLVSDSLDFHPTDVLEDADGSLLVVDTGGWYKLCCPTSQLAKPDVLGAIYRVRRRGAPADARSARAAARVGHADAGRARARCSTMPRPAVRAARDRAARRSSGAHAVPALASARSRERGTPDARRNAVWALTRIDGAAGARGRARRAGRSRRERAPGGASLRRPLARRRRRAAAADGACRPSCRPCSARPPRRSDASATRAPCRRCSTAAALPLDRVLEHSVMYALIEIADPASTAAGLTERHRSRAQRAALIALDQMDAGRAAGRDRRRRCSTRPIRLLQDTAWWIAGQHQDWGETARRGTSSSGWPPAVTAPRSASDLQQKLAQFGGNAAIQQELGRRRSNAATPRDARADGIAGHGDSRA